MSKIFTIPQKRKERRKFIIYSHKVGYSNKQKIMKEKKILKRIVGIGLCAMMMVSLFLATEANAATLSASKEFHSVEYYGASCTSVAKASCPNSGTFKWTTSVTDSKKPTLSYIVYRLGDGWEINNTTKKAVYNWKYVVQRLPSGSSGVSTTVSRGDGTATFTYNSSTKQLSVK